MEGVPLHRGCANILFALFFLSRGSRRRIVNPKRLGDDKRFIACRVGTKMQIEIFAKNMKVTPEIAKQAVDGFFPKSAMQIGEVKDLERSLQDALDYKFIATPKTPADIAGLFDIVYKPK